MILQSYPQGTDSQAWQIARSNRFTASEFSRLKIEMGVKGQPLQKSIDGRMSYIREKVNNCDIDFDAIYQIDNYQYSYFNDHGFGGQAKALKHGNNFEPIARKEYCRRMNIEEVYFNEYFYDLTKDKAERGFMYGHCYVHKKYPFLVSPDGEIKQFKKTIEIKNPDMGNYAQIRDMIKDFNDGNIKLSAAEILFEYDKNYYWQVMNGLYATEAETCDFINFQPYIKSDFQMQILTIERDENVMAEIELILKESTDIYLNLYNKFH